MKDLFLKRKQAFRKECVGYLRYVLNDHFVLFLLVLIGFLAYQYSQLLQHFPENHWPILLFLGIVSALLLAWGGIATYMEVPDKFFLLVSEEEVTSHLKGQTVRSLVFWLFVQTLFLLLFAPLFLAMGYGLPVFLIYVLLLGAAKYFLFRQKASKFSLKLELTGTMLSPKKASASKSCFVSLLSLLRSRAFQIVSNVALIWILSLKQFRKCRARFGKISIFVLICEMETSLPSVCASCSYPC